MKRERVLERGVELVMEMEGQPVQQRDIAEEDDTITKEVEIPLVDTPVLGKEVIAAILLITTIEIVREDSIREEKEEKEEPIIIVLLITTETALIIVVVAVIIETVLPGITVIENVLVPTITTATTIETATAITGVRALITEDLPNQATEKESLTITRRAGEIMIIVILLHLLLLIRIIQRRRGILFPKQQTEINPQRRVAMLAVTAANNNRGITVNLSFYLSFGLYFKKSTK